MGSKASVEHSTGTLKDSMGSKPLKSFMNYANTEAEIISSMRDCCLKASPSKFNKEVIETIERTSLSARISCRSNVKSNFDYDNSENLLQSLILSSLGSFSNNINTYETISHCVVELKVLPLINDSSKDFGLGNPDINSFNSLDYKPVKKVKLFKNEYQNHTKETHQEVTYNNNNQSSTTTEYSTDDLKSTTRIPIISNYSREDNAHVSKITSSLETIFENFDPNNPPTSSFKSTSKYKPLRSTHNSNKLTLNSIVEKKQSNDINKKVDYTITINLKDVIAPSTNSTKAIIKAHKKLNRYSSKCRLENTIKNMNNRPITSSSRLSTGKELPRHMKFKCLTSNNISFAEDSNKSSSINSKSKDLNCCAQKGFVKSADFLKHAKTVEFNAQKLEVNLKSLKSDKPSTNGGLSSLERQNTFLKSIEALDNFKKDNHFLFEIV